jgi:hypothetical protein
MWTAILRNKRYPNEHRQLITWRKILQVTLSKCWSENPKRWLVTQADGCRSWADLIKSYHLQPWTFKRRFKTQKWSFQ